MDAYAPRIERMMKRLYDSLAEDDRRRYAAIESTKLGHGGVDYISSVLQCDPKTIRRGLAELEETGDLDTSRVRKKGGGRKKLIEISADLEASFFKVLEDHTAGDPMRAEVKWTNLSRGQISLRLGKLGTPASRQVVSQLLRKNGYRNLQNRPEVCRGIQENHEDRLRQNSAEVELPSCSAANVKSGSYFRPVPLHALPRECGLFKAGNRMLLPNGEQAVVDLSKLSDYCLNQEHPRGQHKARVFASSLGLTAVDGELLRAALLTAALDHEARPTFADRYGQRYVVNFMMEGPAGEVLVRSCWIIRAAEDFPRLTSCYVL
jgi:Rhodopirellula transposase DDE domain